MIIIALGANLPGKYGTPSDTLKAAVRSLKDAGIEVVKASRIFLTAPVPFDPGQDWYHNAVMHVETDLTPIDLLDLLLQTEKKFGRVRGVKNAARVLDLDIIAWHDKVMETERLILPHPRLQERLFVLKPLQDIAPDWHHPILHMNIGEMLDHL